MKPVKRQFVQIHFPQQQEQHPDAPEQDILEQSALQAPPSQPWSQMSPIQMSPVQMSPVAMPGMPSRSLPPPQDAYGVAGWGQARWDKPPPLLYPGFANPPVYSPVTSRSPWEPPPPWKGIPTRKKRRMPLWGKIVLTLLLLLLMGLGGVGGYYYYIFSNTLSGVTGQQLNRAPDDQPDPGRKATNGGILSGGRFNILLLGSDTDYKTVSVNGGALAQVDIVVTIDPASKTVGMLSIPRDSWLHVPGYGMKKLDQAYLLGGGGKGGVELTSRTIHQDFGIYIDHYAWVGLDGFIKVINTVGGVDVDVIHPIVDDTYPDDIGDHGKDIYAVKRLSLAPGPQHLDGQQALEYVRSRHADLNGDFGRSARQQQVLNQLKTKLNNSGIIGKLPELANDLKGSVMTDLNLPDVVTLMNFARSLDPNKIKRITLGPPYSETKSIDTDAGLQSVVFLNCNQILPIITPMFGNQAKCDNGYVISSATPIAAHLQPSPALNNGVQVGSVSTGSVENIWQLISQLAGMSAMNGAGSDLLGVHSLLDLLFLGVFESPAALQI